LRIHLKSGNTRDPVAGISHSDTEIPSNFRSNLLWILRRSYSNANHSCLQIQGRENGWKWKNPRGL